MPSDEIPRTDREPTSTANPTLKPVATVGYVESYREMWDRDDADEALA